METSLLPLLPDLELSLLILFISILTALGVYFFSIFGVKEKSFEEAIAEQKKMSMDLLGNNNKGGKGGVVKKKVKPVKKGSAGVGKKAEKKVTPHPAEEEKKEEESTPPLQPITTEKKHIGILDQPINVQEHEPPLRRPSLSSATPTKSILLNKHAPPPSPEQPMEVEELNHFITTHPKDDVELAHAHTDKTTPPVQPEKVEKKKKGGVASNLPQIQSLLSATPPLSPTELQSLIDALLNKQTPSWTPTSPSNKDSLKKLVSAKEAQIATLELNLSSLSQKLTQIRSDSSAEKAKFSAVKKQLEELAAAKTAEVANLTGRLRQLADLSIAKEAELQKSCVLYKARCVEVGEEGERLKGEVGRREGEWRGKVESLEREVGALKVQYGKQGNQLSSAFSQNNDLTTQLLNLTSTTTTLESQLLHAQSIIAEKETLLSHQSLQMEENEQEKNSLLMKISNLDKNLEVAGRKCEDFVQNELNYKKMLEGLEGELRGAQLKVQNLEGSGKEDLVRLEGKNGELRVKNQKLLESLQASEKQFELSKSQADSERSAIYEALLSIGVEFESASSLKSALTQLTSNLTSEKELEILALTSKLSATEQKCEQLGDEVAHYQSVLASTESLLASLQSSIETEETKWLSKLAEKEEKLEMLEARLDEKGAELNGHHKREGEGEHTITTPPPPITTPPPTSPTQPDSPSPSSKSSDSNLDKDKKKKKKVLGFLRTK